MVRKMKDLTIHIVRNFLHHMYGQKILGHTYVRKIKDLTIRQKLFTLKVESEIVRLYRRVTGIKVLPQHTTAPTPPQPPHTGILSD